MLTLTLICAMACPTQVDPSVAIAIGIGIAKANEQQFFFDGSLMVPSKSEPVVTMRSEPVILPAKEEPATPPAATEEEPKVTPANKIQSLDREFLQKYHWKLSSGTCGMLGCTIHGGGWRQEPDPPPEYYDPVKAEPDPDRAIMAAAEAVLDTLPVRRARLRLIVVSPGDAETTWCEPCRKLYIVLEGLRPRRNWVVWYTDAENPGNKAFNEHYNINTFPHLMIYRDTEVMDSRDGFQTEEQITTWIDQVAVRK